MRFSLVAVKLNYVNSNLWLQPFNKGLGLLVHKNQLNCKLAHEKYI